MDESLSKALKKREELKATLAKVEQFLALHTELFGAEGERGETPSASQERPASESVAPPLRRGANVSALVDMSERVIREAGRPMTRGELVAALEERDVRMGTIDPARYLGTILWRHQEKFENIEGRGYWLKGEPLPDA